MCRLERFERGKELYELRKVLRCGEEDALEFVGYDLDAVEESIQRLGVTIVGGDQLADLSDRRTGVWIEKPEFDTELITGQREHPAKLPAAKHADFHSAAAGSR